MSQQTDAGYSLVAPTADSGGAIVTDDASSVARRSTISAFEKLSLSMAQSKFKPSDEEWREYHQCIRRMAIVSEGRETSRVINNVAFNVTSFQDYLSWLYLTGVLSKVLKHPLDPPAQEEDVLPGPHACHRAVMLMVGPRGLLHGWEGETPDITFVRSSVERGDSSLLPLVWEFDENTDGESSYHSDSPTYQSDSEAYHPVTNHVVTDDDISKNLRNCKTLELFLDRLDVHDVKVCKNVYRFRDYVASSNRQRRVRRSLRRERRLARQIAANSAEPQPAFNLETKRKRILEKESKRFKRNDQKCSDFKLEIFLEYEKVSMFLPDDIFQKDLALKRIHDMRNNLRTQILKTWTQYYGNRRGLAADQRLNCWITPVRFISQYGPNCGMAALAMAMRPVLSCEAMAGGAADGGGATNDGSEADPLVERNVQAILQWAIEATRLMGYSDSNSRLYVPGPNNPSLEYVYLNPPCPNAFYTDGLKAGITGHGEMFSARELAKLAQKYENGRHIVRLVKRDLLDDTLLEPGKSVGADVQEDDEVTATEFGTSWLMSVVDRLMRGFLIAVCFDCDRNMMPGSTQSGSKAHWALLCGVVVLTKDGELTENHYFKPELKLQRDVDRIWVIARHGKMAGPRYSLWPLKELVNSNRQLRRPSSKILKNREKTYTITPSVRCGENSKVTDDQSRPETAPKELSVSEMISQENSIPPPPPLPLRSPSPMEVLMEKIKNDNIRSKINWSQKFVFPEGIKLQDCLARQYVSFEPLYHPNLMGDHKTTSYHNLMIDPLAPILYQFSYKSNQDLSETPPDTKMEF